MSWTHTRAQIARTKKADPTADVSQLKLQLREEHLADYIQRTVDASPPLTAAQRDRLATLLRSGGGNDAA